MTSNGNLHPIEFHSWTFSTLELNYNIHDKKLLAIFETFKQWQHYLEGSGLPINVVTNHQNLQYFSMTKFSHVDKHIGPNIFLDLTW